MDNFLHYTMRGGEKSSDKPVFSQKCCICAVLCEEAEITENPGHPFGDLCDTAQARIRQSF